MTVCEMPLGFSVFLAMKGEVNDVANECVVGAELAAQGFFHFLAVVAGLVQVPVACTDGFLDASVALLGNDGFDVFRCRSHDSKIKGAQGPRLFLQLVVNDFEGFPQCAILVATHFKGGNAGKLRQEVVEFFEL